jgi:hypothetical protein
MPVDFKEFPKDELERLEAYQLQRDVDETMERKLVAEAVFRKNLGYELTQSEQNLIAKGEAK